MSIYILHIYLYWTKIYIEYLFVLYFMYSDNKIDVVYCLMAYRIWGVEHIIFDPITMITIYLCVVLYTIRYIPTHDENILVQKWHSRWKRFIFSIFFLFLPICLKKKYIISCLSFDGSQKKNNDKLRVPISIYSL